MDTEPALMNAHSWLVEVRVGFIRKLYLPNHVFKHPIQTGSRLPGTVWKGRYLFYDRPIQPIMRIMPPPAGDNHGWVVFAVRTGFALGHRASIKHARMRTFDNSSCAISITSPRSLFRPRTQHGRWGHREKSRQASTRWWLPGKVLPSGTFPAKRDPVWNAG